VNRIAAIVLAAGESKRLGQPKQLVEWHGRPLIKHVAQTASDAGLDPVVVVVGYRADVMRSVMADSAVILADNTHWPEGLSTSVRAGLLALPAEVDAAFFLHVDQPHVGADHLRAMIAAYHTSGKPIVASAFHGRRASPALFDRSLFDPLMLIRGDRGGRSIVDTHPDWVETVEAANEWTLEDIDTQEDLERARTTKDQ